MCYYDEWTKEYVQVVISEYLEWLEGKFDDDNLRHLSTKQRNNAIEIYSYEKTAATYLSDLIAKSDMEPYIVIDGLMERLHRYSKEESNFKRKETFFHMWQTIEDIVSLLM